MADTVDSSQSPASSQSLAAESQVTAENTAVMRPSRRRARAAASPSPAPQGRASTPVIDPVTGQVIPDKGGISRTPVPAKYSTSYGSPMTQLPNRSTVGAGGNITKVAAEIFTKVKRDNVVAEARRRIKDQERAARADSQETTASSASSSMQLGIEVGRLESEEQSEEQGTSGEEGSEYGDSQTRRPATRSSSQNTAGKRARDDEAEALAEQERQERDAWLRRERLMEARARRNERLVEAEAVAAREKAEQERLVQERLAQEQLVQERLEQERLEQERFEQERIARATAAQERLAQAAREKAAKAAMPPPPPPPASQPPPAITFTPASATIEANPSTNRPGSARSFIEESNVFHDAGVQTPTPPPSKNARRPEPSASETSGQPAQPPRAKTGPAATLSPDPASPPSVLKRPPRRPGGTPASRAGQSASQDHRRSTTQPVPAHREPQQPSASDRRAVSSYATQLRNRIKPFAVKAVSGEERRESRPDSGASRYRPSWSSISQSSALWSVLKGIAVAYIILHFMHLIHIFVQPDFFDTPVFTPTWYGWDNWADNIGQFFPSPLPHVRSVLSNDQYVDLKDYLQRRTTATEAAVSNVKAILPKVVSVQKDKKGNIVIAKEFWDALQDRIQHDSNILTLDRNHQVSDKHWGAVEQRLKKAGMLRKILSTEDVERIVDRSAPASWEKWLEKNKRKVADIVGGGKGPPKGPGETVVSRDEFIAEVKDRLAKSKKEVDTELDGLRRELRGLLPEVKRIASSGGMSRADTTTLIKQVVDQEITRRITGIGSKPGRVGTAIDAAFHNRVNHFSPGNNAQVELSLSSPTYETATPPIGSKKWLKTMKRQTLFLQDKSQALTPWSEPGHCWCAGTLGDNNRTLPAVLAVKLPQFVIPQYVLLEHIDPAATLDPLSMPRDVEVWAVFDEKARRERVLDWMAAQFPSSAPKGAAVREDRAAAADRQKAEAKLIDNGFAKIGQFTYEHRARDGGVFVHRLSLDLVERLKAATDLVMVRAVTNYGARDHTCFYRVRLYGDAVEELEAEKESRKW